MFNKKGQKKGNGKKDPSASLRVKGKNSVEEEKHLNISFPEEIRKYILGIGFASCDYNNFGFYKKGGDSWRMVSFGAKFFNW